MTSPAEEYQALQQLTRRYANHPDKLLVDISRNLDIYPLPLPQKICDVTLGAAQGAARRVEGLVDGIVHSSPRQRMAFGITAGTLALQLPGHGSAVAAENGNPHKTVVANEYENPSVVPDSGEVKSSTTTDLSPTSVGNLDLAPLPPEQKTVDATVTEKAVSPVSPAKDTVQTLPEKTTTESSTPSDTSLDLAPLPPEKKKDAPHEAVLSTTPVSPAKDTVQDLAPMPPEQKTVDAKVTEKAVSPVSPAKDTVQTLPDAPAKAKNQIGETPQKSHVVTSLPAPELFVPATFQNNDANKLDISMPATSETMPANGHANNGTDPKHEDAVVAAVSTPYGEEIKLKVDKDSVFTSVNVLPNVLDLPVLDTTLPIQTPKKEAVKKPEIQDVALAPIAMSSAILPDALPAPAQEHNPFVTMVSPATSEVVSSNQGIGNDPRTPEEVVAIAESNIHEAVRLEPTRVQNVIRSFARPDFLEDVAPADTEQTYLAVPAVFNQVAPPVAKTVNRTVTVEASSVSGSEQKIRGGAKWLEDQLGVTEATGRNDGLPAKLYTNGRPVEWCDGFVFTFLKEHGFAFNKNVPGVDKYGNMLWVPATKAAFKSGVQNTAFYSRASVEKGKYTPKLGDVVFLDGHIAVYYKAASNGFYTIGGNEPLHRGGKANAVRKTFYKTGDAYVEGIGALYAHPIAKPVVKQAVQEATVQPAVYTEAQKPGNAFGAFITQAALPEAAPYEQPLDALLPIPSEATPTAEAPVDPVQSEQPVATPEPGSNGKEHGNEPVVVSLQPGNWPNTGVTTLENAPIPTPETPKEDTTKTDKPAEPKPAETAPNPNKDSSFKVNLAAFQSSILIQESGGRFHLKPNSYNCSGGYQIGGMWNNYQGYSAAYLAPPSVQYEFTQKKLTQYYEKFHDWKKVAMAWYAGPGYEKAGFDIYRRQGGGAYPSISDYGNKAVKRMNTYIADPSKIFDVPGIATSVENPALDNGSAA